MTDVAFLERTLGTKFSPLLGWEDDPEKVLVYSDSVLSNPIYVTSYVDKNANDIKQQNAQIAFIRFSGIPFDLKEPNFIGDCLGLTSADFISFFGPYHLGGVGSALQYMPTPGKNDTKLEIGYLYDASGYPAPELETVEQVEIIQWK